MTLGWLDGGVGEGGGGNKKGEKIRKDMEGKGKEGMRDGR